MIEGRPHLSVVVASVNGRPVLDECLASLEAQRGPRPEVIVVDVTGPDTTRFVQDRFPWITVVPCEDRRTIPQLRALGLTYCSGEIVAVIEDHCVADAGWSEAIIEAHLAHPECAAVGGVVDNGHCTRLTDWAAFFCEYSAYMPPRPLGVTTDVPGNNIAYKRRVLEPLAELQETLHRGFWETTLHPRLLKHGERFFLDPAIIVYHEKPFAFRYFLIQRYHYSRYYTGVLLDGAALPRRVARALASLALPPVLLFRIGRRVARTGRHTRHLILAMPMLGIFTGAWAAGEFVGCLRGPGRSLQQVE